jgi:hypothetical protein
MRESFNDDISAMSLKTGLLFNHLLNRKKRRLI